MANCYRCGKPIPPGKYQQRRKLRTGEWLRRPRRDAAPTSVNVHFGLRVVCRRCAADIDREWRLREALQYVELGIAILVLLAALASRLL